MDTKQQLDELLDHYLSGKMSADEKAAFELQISQDTHLKEELYLHEHIIDAIKKKNLKRILQRKEQNIRYGRQHRKIFIRTISGIAAAASILFAVLFINDSSYYKSNGTLCYTELHIPIARSGDDTDSLLYVAYEQIDSKHYKDAIQNLDMVIKILQQEIFDTSREEGLDYQKIAKQKMDDAAWMKAIIYMKQGKKCKAKKALKQIADGDGEYKQQAEKVLLKEL